jgi:hypothetical protein
MDSNELRHLVRLLQREIGNFVAVRAGDMR